MREKGFVSLLVITLLLVACAGPTSITPIAETVYPSVPSPISTVPISYPAPALVVTEPGAFSYPEPGTPFNGTLAIPSSGYEPQPGDANLQRDQVLLDLASSQITKTATVPTQVTAILNGNLSDPCHKLRVVVTPSYSISMININVYSVVDPSANCIMVIEPFTATIPLGNYSNGHYPVYVNGQLLGEFGK